MTPRHLSEADNSDWMWSDAIALLNQLRQGGMEPADLLAGTLERARRLDAKLNCINTFFEERVGRSLEQGPRDGRLSGLPILVKDLSCFVQGEPYSGGTTLLKEAGYRAGASSYFVEALEAAGAIIFGNTNTPELGSAPATESKAFGASIALGSAGASLSKAVTNPTLTATLGGHSRTHSTTVLAQQTLPSGTETSKATSVGSAGALIGVNGANTHATSGVNADAQLTAGVVAQADGTIRVDANVASKQSSDSLNAIAGLAAIGFNRSEAQSTNKARATVGAGANVRAGALQVLAGGSDIHAAKAQSASANLVNIPTLDFSNKGTPSSAHSLNISGSTTAASLANSTSASPTSIIVDSLKIDADHQNDFAGSAFSQSMSLAGASGPILENTAQANTSTHVGDYVQVTAGSIVVTADSATDKAAGASAEVSSGAATALGVGVGLGKTTVNHNTNATIGTGAQLTTTSALGEFRVTAGNDSSLSSHVRAEGA